MTDQAKKSDKSNNRVLIVAVVVAIIGIGWGILEHRHGNVLNDALNKSAEQVVLLQKQADAQAQELTSLNKRFNDWKQRKVPISLIFRPTASRKGLEAYFKNDAPTPTQISVVLGNPTTNRRMETNLIIPANGVRSVGEADGWVFAPGHTIQIADAQFGKIDYVVPAQ